MQPRVRPIINQKFVGKRIDVLYLFDILDGDGNGKIQSLRWCQGEVTKVFNGKTKPTVEVLWDDIQESIDTKSRSNVVLNDGKWNKNCEGVWRMDVNNANLEDDSDSDTDNNE